MTSVVVALAMVSLKLPLAVPNHALASRMTAQPLRCDTHHHALASTSEKRGDSPYMYSSNRRTCSRQYRCSTLSVRRQDCG